ncbi:PEBP family protein [uncultured Roseibium sp.]|uniref:PEBP family protein n=1 Tax=uncultured Roseibium sp. TaxID=1936171 RepID=UPI00260251A2|nr:PEBP family protein [uncultured Roseibium sp.]
MKLSAILTSKFAVTVAVALAAVPAAAFAQKPPPPPGGKAPPPRGVQGQDLNESTIRSQGAHKILGEVWVDNWFTLYINGAPLLEDSVSIRTERSFNAERFDFNADLPMTIAFEFRDFMENSTGLEYIGTRRQQMGDGGAIAQFHDAASGRLLAATGSDWRCLTVQSAPADRSCESDRKPDVSSASCAQTVTPTPDGWMAPDFDDSSWPAATVHSTGNVSPKGGYDRITWDGSARLIWGPDLEKDNILYCRVTVGG